MASIQVAGGIPRVHHHRALLDMSSPLFPFVHSWPLVHRPVLPTFSPLHHPRLRSLALHASSSDDIEVAVFRFTLGIPGFDDALIPRVIGILGSLLIVLNHTLSPQPVSLPQTRIEAIGAALAAVAVAAPSLQRRLEELQPGRGRRAAADSVEGSANVFAVADDLPTGVKQELAWSSYALLRNANTCGAFVTWKGRVVMCRGALGTGLSAPAGAATAAAGGGGNGSSSGVALERAEQAWTNTKSSTAAREMVVLGDRGAIDRAGFGGNAVIPSGVKSALIVPLAPLPPCSSSSALPGSGEGELVLVSERERALSTKEQRWAQGIAAKLHAALSPLQMPQ